MQSLARPRLDVSGGGHASPGPPSWLEPGVHSQPPARWHTRAPGQPVPLAAAFAFSRRTWRRAPTTGFSRDPFSPASGSFPLGSTVFSGALSQDLGPGSGEQEPSLRRAARRVVRGLGPESPGFGLDVSAPPPLRGPQDVPWALFRPLPMGQLRLTLALDKDVGATRGSPSQVIILLTVSPTPLSSLPGDTQMPWSVPDTAAERRTRWAEGEATRDTLRAHVPSAAPDRLGPAPAPGPRTRPPPPWAEGWR